MSQEIVIDGWTLSRFEVDGEPRVRDIDLAERLGFTRPRAIRELISRLEADGRLGEVRRTARRTSEGGAPGNEAWLTEAQALKVAAKSETAKADALLDEIIHVFMLARRGLLPQQRAGALSAGEITTIVSGAVSAALAVFKPQLDEINRELRSVRDATTGLAGGMIDRQQEREIRARITRVAHAAEKVLPLRFGQIHKRFDDRIREAIGFQRGGGCRWRNLPIEKLGPARIALERLEKEIADSVRASNVRAQETLPSMERAS